MRKTTSIGLVKCGVCGRDNLWDNMTLTQHCGRVCEACYCYRHRLYTRGLEHCPLCCISSDGTDLIEVYAGRDDVDPQVDQGVRDLVADLNATVQRVSDLLRKSDGYGAPKSVTK